MKFQLLKRGGDRGTCGMGGQKVMSCWSCSKGGPEMKELSMIFYEFSRIFYEFSIFLFLHRISMNLISMN